MSIINERPMNVWGLMKIWHSKIEDSLENTEQMYIETLVEQLEIIDWIYDRRWEKRDACNPDPGFDIEGRANGEGDGWAQMIVLKRELEEAWGEWNDLPKDWKYTKVDELEHKGRVYDKWGYAGSCLEINKEIYSRMERLFQMNPDRPLEEVYTLSTLYVLNEASRGGYKQRESAVAEAKNVQRLSNVNENLKETIKVLEKDNRQIVGKTYKHIVETLGEDGKAYLETKADILKGLFTEDDYFKNTIIEWIRDIMDTDSHKLVDCDSNLADRCRDIAYDAVHEESVDADRAWEIAREVVDEIDFHDIAYDNDIPNKEEVSEMIADEVQEHLDDVADADNALNESTTSIQGQVRDALINFLTLLKNDLSKKAITVTEEKPNE
tara:strand:- start:5294 stop:6436 length:1143 start_codon:yes stop_codon:yes gene_type:complete